MKKRVSRSVLSLILTLCLTLSMLPSPALAAVGDLVDNDPAENESILSQLEDFSGQSYEEAYTLLILWAFWTRTAIWPPTRASFWTGRSTPWRRSRLSSMTRPPI